MTSTIQISFQYELYSLVSCTNIVHTLPILQDKKNNHIQNNISNITQKKTHTIKCHLKSIWSFFPTFIYHGLHTESVLPDGAPGETAAGKGTGVLTLLA